MVASLIGAEDGVIEAGWQCLADPLPSWQPANPALHQHSHGEQHA